MPVFLVFNVVQIHLSVNGDKLRKMLSVLHRPIIQTALSTQNMIQKRVGTFSRLFDNRFVKMRSNSAVYVVLYTTTIWY